MECFLIKKNVKKKKTRSIKKGKHQQRCGKILSPGNKRGREREDENLVILTRAFSDGKRGRAGYSVRQQDDRGSSSSSAAVVVTERAKRESTRKRRSLRVRRYIIHVGNPPGSLQRRRIEKRERASAGGEESSGVLMIRRVDYCTVRLLSSSLLLASLRDCFLLIGARSQENCVRRIFLPPFFFNVYSCASFKTKC